MNAIIRTPFYCCRASVAIEQQHNQNLRRIYKREYEFSNSSFVHENALQLTRVHCASFYQSALCREQHKDITPAFCVDSSEKGLIVVMFCSNLPVKLFEGDRA